MSAKITFGRACASILALGAAALLAGASVSPAASATDGLVAAYGFEESSGDVVDASGNGNDGTMSGAARGAGRHGSGLAFDGFDDLVTIPDSASLDLTSGLTSRPG